jgi:hypothetical protein
MCLSNTNIQNKKKVMKSLKNSFSILFLILTLPFELSKGKKRKAKKKIKVLLNSLFVLK